MTASGLIGFIGLGNMGLRMATNLVRKQFRVRGYDRRAEAVAGLVAAGGSGAASIEEAARGAETLVLMVVNADQAEDVLLAGGALAALAPSATVVVMATCAPARIADIARRVEETGRQFVDAPVSGGVAGATQGSLTIMAAARKATFERMQPVLETMGSRLYHLGERPGQGAAMKVVNQLLCGVHIVAAAEGLAFAEKEGIDPALALEILSGSAAASWMLKDRGPRMVGADDRITSVVDIFVKDLSLVLDAGRSARIGLPLAAASHQLFLAVSGMGLGEKDDAMVIEAYRALRAKA